MTAQGLSVLSICFLLFGCVDGMNDSVDSATKPAPKIADNAPNFKENPETKATTTAIGRKVSAIADEAHKWERISYPEFECSFGDGTASASIYAATQPDEKGLRFALEFSWPMADENKEGFARPDGSKIRLRLHYADGSVVAPCHSDFTKPFYYSPMGRYWHEQLRCVFPWGTNQMQEGWLELVFPERSYWLAIPYGFTRDPSSAKLPTSNSGRLKLAPAMKTLPKNAQLVNWNDVFYKIGAEDDFFVSLFHSNRVSMYSMPFDARSQISLVRRIRKRSWDLNSPRTSVSILHESGYTLKGVASGVRLSEYDAHRTAEFVFRRNPRDEEIRDWGTIVVTVDDKQWKTIIPSSLYKYLHATIP